MPVRVRVDYISRTSKRWLLGLGLGLARVISQFLCLLLMTSTVEDCILSLDSFIRVGGAVADNDSDESERVQTVLNSASEKFGDPMIPANLLLSYYKL